MYFFCNSCYNVRVENVYRFYKKKYGIGNSISLILSSHVGYHPDFRYKKIPHTYLYDGVKNLFTNRQDLLSLNLKKVMEDNLVKQLKLHTYKGNCIRNGLPLRGQRRRTNAVTVRKLLSKLTFRSSRKVR